MSGNRRVLFVCTANICRSPMAEAIFNDLAEEYGLGAVAESAGVRATGGYDMAENAREALGEVGVMAGPHSSRRVTSELISGFDLVLTMEPEHADAVRKLPGYGGEVATIIEYTGGPAGASVPDPYGMGMFTYRGSVRRIFDYVEDVLDRLQEDGS